MTESEEELENHLRPLLSLPKTEAEKIMEKHNYEPFALRIGVVETNSGRILHLKGYKLM